MTIEENIEASNAADEIHKLASSESFNFKKEAALRFWRRMLENVCAVLPPAYHPQKIVEQQIAPMTNSKCNEFEALRMSFGKHSGKRIADVPLSYLTWLDSEPDFRRALHKYLRNPGIIKEIEQDEN